MSDLYLGPSQGPSQPNPQPSKSTPEDNLREFEQDVFDAMGSITVAICSGLVRATFLQLVDGQPSLTIALNNADKDAPPEARRFSVPQSGATFMHCIDAAGKYLHQQLHNIHLEGGHLQEYVFQRKQIDDMRAKAKKAAKRDRRGGLIVPGTN